MIDLTPEDLKQKPRYRLRYLFYIKKPNLVVMSPEQCPERCANCKTGVSTMIMWGGKTLCLSCMKEMVKEPNTNWNYKWYRIRKWSLSFMFSILEFFHIIRYSHEDRYDMMGDEWMYVGKRVYDLEWNHLRTDMKSRKWWEYIVVKY